MLGLSLLRLPRLRPLAVASAVLAAGVPRLAAQQAGTPPTVDSITVEGAVRNTYQQVISVSGLLLNQPATYRNVQRAIQALFASGQFDDVRVDQRQIDGKFVLAVIVKERPLLQRWALKGVETVDEGTVRRRINVPEGRPLDRNAVQRSRHAVDSLYRKKGYYSAQVNVTEIPQAGNQIRLVFDVNPGPRVVVSQIEFGGNQAFADQAIVTGMATRPEGFWWFRKGEYLEDRLEEDLRTAIPSWYANRGHLDFRVLRDTLVADSIPGKGIIKIDVEEGPAYKVGKFEINGSRRFSNEELSAYLPFGTGVLAGSGKDLNVVFDRGAWDASTERVSNLYANFGYINSNVVPEETRRTGPDGTHYVDLRWNIVERQPATINKIIILGNDVTHERVIREAIVLLPGQIFNRDAFIRSYQNISNLNFFQQPLPPPDVNPAENGVDVDLVFRVTERRTGNINFGASVGQGVGIGGFIGLEEPNLFGKAKQGRLQWQFGRNINDFNLSYTDPAVLESRISGTLTIFNSRRRYTIGDLGRQRSRGAQSQIGFPLLGSRYTRVYLTSGVQQITYSDAQPDLAQQFICDNCTRASVGMSLARDTRIGLPFAIAGSSMHLSLEQNGGPLGGTGNYQKIDLEGRWYAPLGRAGGTDQFGGGVQFTLGLSARSGFAIGNTGPFYTELYSMGGVQYGIPLRGYEEFSITPAGFDPQSNSTRASVSSFGRAYAAFTLEAGARVSQTIYVNLFSDAGNVYARAREFNPTRLFRSVGIGAAVISPLGPIGIDLGYGLDRTDQNGNKKPGWQLHFRLGNIY